MNLIKVLQKKKIQKQKVLFNKDNGDLIAELKQKGITNNRIINSIKKVPREIFTEDNLKKHIYKNIALPISPTPQCTQAKIIEAAAIAITH